MLAIELKVWKFNDWNWGAGLQNGWIFNVPSVKDWMFNFSPI